ncbi:LytR/AlgR family response regulator transcription factor [Aegicerativicinus sediminis]|uniref:LytR/AlgR family response regulator transcription factor n=1 Tax=Aegicerativicinus sediminis TaxID=2893202 RepID=UPI001E531FA9|nr:response regulator transcription factor [Aegicerativicinus sediminis]
MRCNCIIVDDEPPAISILKSYIENVPQLEIVGTCKNVFEAMSILNEKNVDLMFLDIHMPKLIGTQFLKSLTNPPKVIFTTAHKDFAIEAFDLEAIDYLLKPIPFDRFLKAVNRFCDSVNPEIEASENSPAFLYFRADRKMIKVWVDDILYIESFKDYIVIHRLGNPDLRVKQTLSSVEKMLPQNLFLRIHRSFIVATNKITAYTKNDVEIGKIEIPFGSNYGDIISKLSNDSNAFKNEG